MRLRDTEKEIRLLKLAIFDTINSGAENEIFTFSDCLCKLENEIKYKDMEFSVLRDSIYHNDYYQEIADEFKRIDRDEFVEYVKMLVLKIGYYNQQVKSTILNPTDSDINELANEVIYFYKSFEELQEEAEENIYAKYELIHRYYDAGIEKIDFYKCIEELAEKGHKKAKYLKARCLFYGIDIEQDKEQAFHILNELVSETSYSKAITLLGKMYEERYNDADYINKAIELYERVRYIDDEAKYCLGRIYLMQSEVFKDDQKRIEALMLIDEAARMGNNQAINYYITDFYENNKGLYEQIIEFKNAQEKIKMQEEIGKFNQVADELKKNNEEKEKYLIERDKTLANGISEEEKVVIQKQLEETTLSETERRISALYEEYKKMFYNKQMTECGMNAEFFKDLLYDMMPGEYVVFAVKGIDKVIKDGYLNIMNKVKLAIEFSEKYAMSRLEFETISLNPEFYVVDTNNMDKIADVDMTHNEANKIYVEFAEKYKNIFYKYVEGENCDLQIEEIKEIKEKLDNFINKILKK